MDKRAKMNSKVRDGGSWRRKGGERRSQMVAPINRKKKKKTRNWKQNNRVVDC